MYIISQRFVDREACWWWMHVDDGCLMYACMQSCHIYIHICMHAWQLCIRQASGINMSLSFILLNKRLLDNMLEHSSWARSDSEFQSVWVARGSQRYERTSLAITCSTIILRRAMAWVCSVSSLLNWPECLKGGIIRLAQTSARRSWIRNPLSAITSSPGSSKGRTPLILVISLSEMQPV